MPFSADALAYARRLALAELLYRRGAGLVRYPAERRMAVRASQQRAARMAASRPTIAPTSAANPFTWTSRLNEADYARPGSRAEGIDTRRRAPSSARLTARSWRHSTPCRPGNAYEIREWLERPLSCAR